MPAGQFGSPTWDAEGTRQAWSTARTGHGEGLLDSWAGEAERCLCGDAHAACSCRAPGVHTCNQLHSTGATSGASTTLMWECSAANWTQRATVSWGSQSAWPFRPKYPRVASKLLPCLLPLCLPSIPALLRPHFTLPVRWPPLPCLQLSYAWWGAATRTRAGWKSTTRANGAHVSSFFLQRFNCLCTAPACLHSLEFDCSCPCYVCSHGHQHAGQCCLGGMPPDEAEGARHCHWRGLLWPGQGEDLAAKRESESGCVGSEVVADVAAVPAQDKPAFELTRVCHPPALQVMCTGSEFRLQ